MQATRRKRIVIRAMLAMAGGGGDSEDAGGGAGNRGSGRGVDVVKVTAMSSMR